MNLRERERKIYSIRLKSNLRFTYINKTNKKKVKHKEYLN